MGWIIDLSERGDDVRRFEHGLKKAKMGIAEAYDIFEDMKDQFGERRGYDERYDHRYDHRYDMPQGVTIDHRVEPWHERSHVISERDWQELQERRRRDSYGHYM